MSPGDFVKLLAELLGVPRKGVVVVDRALAQAGMRSLGGRGPSAARITPRDAVTLLVAVMATLVLTRANETVARWRRAAWLETKGKMPARLKALLPWKRGAGLLDCLEDLITRDPADWKDMHIVLDLGIDTGIAELRFEHGGGKQNKVSLYFGQLAEGTTPPAPGKKHGDLWRRASVTGETLRALHDAIAS